MKQKFCGCAITNCSQFSVILNKVVCIYVHTYSMVPIKRNVFLLTVYGMKNTVRLIGTLE